jgi:hypothetical protein
MHAESHPFPHGDEQVCFVPFLLHGLGFPIHPFLRGLLEFYGIQLHHLTPNSILHIAEFVALCEMHLGTSYFRAVEEVFLYDALLPRWETTRSGSSRGLSNSQDRYPIGTPREDSNTWASDWFYMADVSLHDWYLQTKQGSVALSQKYPNE